jgi:hypothetical protein
MHSLSGYIDLLDNPIDPNTVGAQSGAAETKLPFPVLKENLDPTILCPALRVV